MGRDGRDQADAHDDRRGKAYRGASRHNSRRLHLLHDQQPGSRLGLPGSGDGRDGALVQTGRATRVGLIESERIDAIPGLEMSPVRVRIDPFFLLSAKN